MSVPDDSIGRRVQCPQCEYVFRYTGQRDITLGRVRQRVMAGGFAPLAAPIAALATPFPPAQAPTVGDLSAMPMTDPEIVLDDVQTMPVIDLPEVPQALLDQLRITPQADAEPGPELEEPLDLDMFHAAPVEANLPEVTEAEIEALFLEPEPIADEVSPDKPAGVGELPPIELPESMVVDEVQEFVADVSADPVLEWQGDDELAEVAAIEEVDDVEAVAEPIEMVEELDEIAIADVEEIDEPPLAAHPLAAPVASAVPPSAYPVAAPMAGVVKTAVPVAGVPMAGVVMAAPVASPMAGPVLAAPILAAPIAAALPATPIPPVSNTPIPPPTPAARTPIADDDLDALFLDALGDGPPADNNPPIDAVENVEEFFGEIEEIAEPMPDADVVEALDVAEVESAEPIEEIPADAEIVTPEATPPARPTTEVAEDDLDLSALFQDIEASIAESEPVEEIVEDAAILFEDETPPDEPRP